MVTPSTLDRLNLVCENGEALYVGGTATKAVCYQYQHRPVNTNIQSARKIRTKIQLRHRKALHARIICYKAQILDAFTVLSFVIFSSFKIHPRMMMVIGGISSSLMKLTFDA